jgi:hypothetical protein
MRKPLIVVDEVTVSRPETEDTEDKHCERGLVADASHISNTEKLVGPNSPEAARKART